MPQVESSNCTRIPYGVSAHGHLNHNHRKKQNPERGFVILDHMTKKLWFKAKTYGWGWTPCSWEGWSAIVIFAVFQVWNFMRLDEISHSASDTLRPFLIQSVIATLVLIGIAYARGEKPGWRWGNKQ